jgi:hypothetical protein
MCDMRENDAKNPEDPVIDHPFPYSNGHNWGYTPCSDPLFQKQNITNVSPVSAGQFMFCKVV